ncbi:MAG: GMC oxidoreductase [Pararhizobium sp.]
MPIYSLDALEDCRKVDGAYCVIGAGVAGLLFAQRVAKSGRKVIVVESGAEGFNAEIHGLNAIDDPARRYARELDGRYRAFGGSSTRWGGRMIPISGHEMRDRPYLSQRGWDFPPEALDGYNRDIEAIFGLDPESCEVNAHSQAQEVDGVFGRDDPFVKIRWAKCPPFNKVNLGSLLKDFMRRTPNIEVWLGATVCDFKVDRENRRLAGITARHFGGRTLEVTAERFIVAAGTIETTRLLLLLDAAADNHVFRGCTALGRYFQDHLKAHVASISRRDADYTNRLFAYRFVGATRRDLHLELSERAQREDGVASAFAYVAPRLEGSPLGAFKQLAHDIQQDRFAIREVWRLSANIGVVARSVGWRLLRQQLYLPPGVDLKLMVCGEQLPAWQNRLSLSDRRDRFGVPMARLEWGPGEADERMFRSAIVQIGRFWRRLGLEERCPLEWQPATSPTIERAEACAHPSGSTRLGTDWTTSVVGPDLRCHAIPNVSVASASVFPSAGSANPTLTIMRLALWLADSHCNEALQPLPTPVLQTLCAAGH